MTPRLTIDEIRAQYPHPISLRDASDDTEDGTYCVGGAACLAHSVFSNASRLGRSFPSNTFLAKALRQLNPRLDTAIADHAVSFADAIIERNDARDVEQAWELLRQALAYR